jgi:hypothetical protein
MAAMELLQTAMELLQIWRLWNFCRYGGCGASTCYRTSADMVTMELLYIWSFCRYGGYGFFSRYGCYGASADMEAVELLMAMELRPFSVASLPSVR